MSSSIGWLDHSEEQQRKMREVIALFAESGTVDDIGIGVVRDAFSNLLFPGLSTVQTRIRYFLFVPWVYQRLEAERVRSDRAEEKAREWEIELIFSPMRGGAADGVIGREAQRTLKQLPSYIYWNGLRSFGIRSFTGSRVDYFRSMNRINQSGRRDRAEGDDHIAVDHRRWHPNLPDPPADLWEQTTLDLTAEEAAYFQERMAASHPQSLLACLVRSADYIDTDLPFVWSAVDSTELPATVAATVDTARYFSEVIHGASLLYNYQLAEAAAQRGLAMGEDRLAQYSERLTDWQGMIETRRPAHAAVGLSEFWAMVYSSGAIVSGPARRFITQWLEAVARGVVVLESDVLKQAIRQRERQLKKGQARLVNPRTLERWNGGAGVAQLSFRWAEGRAAVNDIANGLATA